VDSYAHLARIDLNGWQQLHHHGVVMGCGLVIDADIEGVAACEELIAIVLVELVGIGALAACADGPGDPPVEFLDVLREGAAATLHLVDRALAADGRDAGYSTSAWLHRAMLSAHAQASAVVASDPQSPGLLGLVVAAADNGVGAITALERDHFAVSEGLCDALGSLLVLFAATTGPRPG
jgi:hypothetical protein